jgi:thiamine biosynthesis lipoprotein
MVDSIQREFRVMGNQACVLMHHGSEELLDRAEARLRELESLWSRFLSDSDISRANRASGTPVQVHDDTLAVVGRALDAWRQTDGRFDITVLPALLDHGYTHSLVDNAIAPPVPGRRIGMSAWVQVDYVAGTLTVPATSAIDLGGIGKGMAADIVAEEAVEAGVVGVVVNVGGDIAVMGEPVDDVSWYMGIENPFDESHHVARLRVQVGGLATSGTTNNRWTLESGRVAHHLINPTSGAPATTRTITATVLASDAATAESFATAAMMMEAAEAVELLDGLGLAGLLVVDDGQVFRTSTLKDFEV